MTTPPLSNCCQAPIEAVPTYLFQGSYDIVCSKCKHICDRYGKSTFGLSESSGGVAEVVASKVEQSWEKEFYEEFQVFSRDNAYENRIIINSVYLDAVKSFFARVIEVEKEKVVREQIKKDLSLIIRYCDAMCHDTLASQLTPTQE